MRFLNDCIYDVTVLYINEISESNSKENLAVLEVLDQVRSSKQGR